MKTLLKTASFLLCALILFTSCSENKKIVIQQSPKPEYFNNYGINRVTKLDNRGRFLGGSPEKIKDPDVSMNSIIWTDENKETVVLRRSAGDIVVDEITYNGSGVNGLKGMSVTKIIEDFTTGDYELIQNIYSNGIIYLKNMFPNKEAYVVLVKKKNGKTDERSISAIIIEVSKGGKVKLVKRYDYYDGFFITALSYDNDTRIAISCGNCDSGYVEIYQDENKLKELYISGETDY